MDTPTPTTDTRETASAHYLPGTRLGPYEILELVGVGGMGEVYRARDTRLNRIVAIKVLPRIAALDPMLRLRVEQEARTVAGMSHPHICALFDIGCEGEIDAADDSDPIWSPDGRWVVFSSSRGGGRDLYRRLSSGAGQDERLFRTPRTKYPSSWSRDGRFILFTSREEETEWDIWLYPLAGGAPVSLVSTPAVEIEPQLSPDGRWLAYTTDESGRLEVFVRPFRAPGGAWLISTGGGSDPRWRDDGLELYYLSPDRSLMAVSVGAGRQFEASRPKALFRTRTSGPLGLGVRFNYAVGPGGRRFLISADAPDTVPSPIEIVLNWRADQER